MAETPKIRRIVSYEKMSDEVAAAFAEKYPHGYADYFPELKEYKTQQGDFHAVSVELPDAIYMIKIVVKVDDKADLDRWFDEQDGNDEEDGSNDA